MWLSISKQFKGGLRSLVISPSGNSKFADLIRSTTRGETSARRLRLDALRNTEQSKVVFPFLTRFEVDLPQSRIIFDQDVQHLAAACPNLEVLKLCPLSRWPISFGPPKVTLSGLALLTAGCPRLHTLHLPIHAFRTDNPTLFEIETSSRSLSTLHLGHSWVDDPLNVAIHISHFAPYLDTLRFFREKNRPGYVEAHAQGWQRVTEILPQLQQLRLHERSHSQASGFPPRPATPTPAVDYPAYVRLPGTPPLLKAVSRAVQATPLTRDLAVQTKLNVRHKNISTKPVPSEMRDEGIDARPFVRDEKVEAKPSTSERAISVQPLLVSKLVETISAPEKVTVDASTSTVDEKTENTELDRRPEPSGYLARFAATLAQFMRAVSPPILLRLLSFFRIWSVFAIRADHGA